MKNLDDANEQIPIEVVRDLLALARALYATFTAKGDRLVPMTKGTR